jgi:16S rRNA (guanine527-N7)-methyltransferase
MERRAVPAHHTPGRPPTIAMSRSQPALAAELAADRARALALTPVSRETIERLDQFVSLLGVWQRTTQLIAASTVPNLWTRHVADSLQLLDLAPTAQTWVDLGTGGGFPGLVLACALAARPGACVQLVESNSKKAAFLREAVRMTKVPAVVHAMRIAEFAHRFEGRAEVITARALAPLKLLLDQSFALWTEGAVAVFPKGQDVEAELTEATKYWNMESTLVPSRTDPSGRIVVIRVLQRRPGAQDARR